MGIKGRRQRCRKAAGPSRNGTVLMPIQEAPLRVFRMFIWIKRVPLLLHFSPLPPLPFVPPSPAAHCPPDVSATLSAIQKYFYFPFYPSSRGSACVLNVPAFMRSSIPLHCTPFTPPPLYTTYPLFVFLQGTRMPLLHSNTSSTLLT